MWVVERPRCYVRRWDPREKSWHYREKETATEDRGKEVSGKWEAMAPFFTGPETPFVKVNQKPN